MKHWLAHRLGWNLGRGVSWWAGDRLMMAFKCDGCQSLSHIHESVVRWPRTV